MVFHCGGPVGRFLLFFQLFVHCNFRRTSKNLALISGSKVSHDTLNRVLYDEWSGKEHLAKIIRSEKLRGGYLSLDDTSIEKPTGKSFEGTYYYYSSTLKKLVRGYQLVLLVWHKGKKRIVIGKRIYQPESGKSKIDLALELLSEARNQFRLKPDFVLFDSWYCSKSIMKRVRDYGWGFISRIKKNRLFNGKKLKKYKINPYWNETGWLAGGVKVRVVKHDNKFFVTNRLSTSRNDILRIYQFRQAIEEVNKQLKFLGLNDCQCRSFKAQSLFIWMCILAYALLEKESRKRSLG